eukprot:3465194-Alexandrium_andersonii.AAC.1
MAPARPRRPFLAFSAPLGAWALRRLRCSRGLLKQRGRSGLAGWRLPRGAPLPRQCPLGWCAPLALLPRPC